MGLLRVVARCAVPALTMLGVAAPGCVVSGSGMSPPDEPTPAPTTENAVCTGPALSSVPREDTPECARAAAGWNVPDAHRECASDDDCALASMGCTAATFARAHDHQYRSRPSICEYPPDPRRGPCSPPHLAFRAACVTGCCTIE